MRGQSPENWLALGEGAGDLAPYLHDVKVVAVEKLVDYYERSQPVIQAARWMLLTFGVTLAVTWLGGIVLMLILIKPHDAIATITVFSGVISGGATALSVAAAYLNRLERKALRALRLALRVAG